MVKPQKFSEKRISFRFDKVFPVVLASDVFGRIGGVARNISAGGMWVEMFDPLPLGQQVTVHFAAAGARRQHDRDLVALAEIKHHYCFNYHVDREPARCRGVGLRFIEFFEESRDPYLRAPNSIPTAH